VSWVGCFSARLLENYEDFAVDLDAASVSLSRGPQGKTLPITLVGSWSEETESFLWGWANEAAGAALTSPVAEFHKGLQGRGLRALTKPDLGCPEAAAHRLARHAAARMGLPGLLRTPFETPTGKGTLYLGLVSLG
jgi:hypothetical protein